MVYYIRTLRASQNPENRDIRVVNLAMKRTSQQNRAIHLACKKLANELNLAGLDMKAVLKPNVDIPWGTESVKEFIFKPIMKARYLKQSTTELEKTTGEIQEIWDIIMRHMGEKFGIEYIPFPSQTEINHENDAKNMANKLKNQADYPTMEQEPSF